MIKDVEILFSGNPRYRIYISEGIETKTEIAIEPLDYVIFSQNWVELINILYTLYFHEPV